MRIRPLASAALIVAGLGFVHLQAAAAAEAETCMVYSEVSHNESQSLDVKLANSCKAAMTCSVDWTITCAKSTKVVHNAAVLGSATEQAWVASAATCKENWSIATTWHCDPK